MVPVVESFLLDPGAPEPLFRQLYSELRMAILSGRLVAGTRLPSTRDFARDLSVSRNTVLVAFEQLIAEGFLEGKTGSGTYVAEALSQKHNGNGGKRRPGDLSARGKALLHTPSSLARALPGVLPFRPGTPALDRLPFRTWLRLEHACIKNMQSSILGYGDRSGYAPLREAIAVYLRAARGVMCTANQIVVVAGSQQALDLAAKVLADPGDLAWIENPCYTGARGALTAAGLQISPVSLDEEGMNPAIGKGKPRLIYVTPSHQFPTGVVMSLARRLSLLDFADRSRAWILEDDYDSEFRYSGRPIASLQGLDNSGSVIYIGTFSKVLFPALRLGYMVVPEDLVPAFAAARALVDRQPPVLQQMVMAEFLSKGYFARHVRKMRLLYAERQRALLDAAQSCQGLFTIAPADTGMHLLARLRKKLTDRKASRMLADAGIEAPPLSAYGLTPLSVQALLLGYAAYEPAEIHDAMLRMRKVLSGC